MSRMWRCTKWICRLVWFDPYPPCKPWHGTLSTHILWIKRTFRDRGLMVAGFSPTRSPYQYQAGSGGVTPMNIPTGPPCIPGIVPNLYATPCMTSPTWSSLAHIYPQRTQRPFETIGRSYLWFFVTFICKPTWSNSRVRTYRSTWRWYGWG